MPKVRKVIKIVQPEFIKELELNTVGNLSELAKLVPCSQQDKKSSQTHASTVCIFGRSTYTPLEERNVTEIISLFPKQSYLQHLTIDVYFLKDHMNELFR